MEPCRFDFWALLRLYQFSRWNTIYSYLIVWDFSPQSLCLWLSIILFSSVSNLRAVVVSNWKCFNENPSNPDEMWRKWNRQNEKEVIVSKFKILYGEKSRLIQNVKWGFIKMTNEITIEYSFDVWQKVFRKRKIKRKKSLDFT